MQLRDSAYYIAEAFRHPDKVFAFGTRKFKDAFLWDQIYAALRDPKVKSPVPLDPAVDREILKELELHGLQLEYYSLDREDYSRYLSLAAYHHYPRYHGGGRHPDFPLKTLQHYLAAKLLELHKDDVFIDIASANSPAAFIYETLHGCKAYRQDLSYPPGITGRAMGGSAAALPVPGGFCTKMALHCSFEHFGGEADIGFIKEANRVLVPGGRLCVIPLYLFNRYAIQTDPAVLPLRRMEFEEDAVLYCAKGYRNRHGRFYDVPHLVARVVKNLQALRLTIYIIPDEKAGDPSSSILFAALFEKASPER
jgi:hypothetical protein